MPVTSTAMPAHRSPGVPPSRTCLPALVPSCQEKGQATGCDFLIPHYSCALLLRRFPIQPEKTTGMCLHNSQPCNKEQLCDAPVVPV